MTLSKAYFCDSSVIILIRISIIYIIDRALLLLVLHMSKLFEIDFEYHYGLTSKLIIFLYYILLKGIINYNCIYTNILWF